MFLSTTLYYFKMNWFGNTWTGKTVLFRARDDQPASSWTLGAKLFHDGENRAPAEYLKRGHSNLPAVAWAPFLCTPKDDPTGLEHVMKIYMQ